MTPKDIRAQLTPADYILRLEALRFALVTRNPGRRVTMSDIAAACVRAGHRITSADLVPSAETSRRERAVAAIEATFRISLEALAFMVVGAVLAHGAWPEGELGPDRAVTMLNPEPMAEEVEP